MANLHKVINRVATYNVTGSESANVTMFSTAQNDFFGCFSDFSVSAADLLLFRGDFILSCARNWEGASVKAESVQIPMLYIHNSFGTAGTSVPIYDTGNWIVTTSDGTPPYHIEDVVVLPTSDSAAALSLALDYTEFTDYDEYFLEIRGTVFYTEDAWP